MKQSRILFAHLFIFLVYFGSKPGVVAQLGFSNPTTPLVKLVSSNEDIDEDEYLDYSEVQPSETTEKPTGVASNTKRRGLCTI